MTTPRLLTLLALALTLATAAHAEVDPDYTMTGAVSPSIRTVQILPADISGSTYEGPAVMSLDGSDAVVLSFDELSPDRRYMRYELIHCDALWRPSGLVDPEFLDGFNQADVTDYAFSQGTGTHYVNYRIVVPDENMRPKLPGNYLLRVYPEDDPDTTLLQARFSVTEGSAPVKATATSRTDFDVNGSHQQLDIEVDTRHINLNNIYTDLKVVVEQDGRTDNAVVVTSPMRVSGPVAYFEHNRDLTFAAGNEYRRFEIISDVLPGMGVEQISYSDPFYHHRLYVDSPRSTEPYSYDLARFGRYLLRRDNYSDPATEADYVVVHFALDMPESADYDYYLEGDLTERHLSPRSRMAYDSDTGLYRAALLLKQGAYSYQYLAVPRHGADVCGLTAPVEGDFYQAQHQYTVKVYYRAPGERFDRLASVTVVE